MRKGFVVQTTPTCFESVRAFQYGQFVHIRCVEVGPEKPLSEVVVIHLDGVKHRVHKGDVFDTMSDAYWSAMESHEVAKADIQAMQDTLDKRSSELYNLRYQMRLETD